MSARKDRFRFLLILLGIVFLVSACSQAVQIRKKPVWEWRKGTIYAASPLCLPLLDQDGNPLKDAGGNVRTFNLYNSQTRADTGIKFCDTGLFLVEYLVGEEGDWVLITVLKFEEEKLYLVHTQEAWENSAADPNTDPKGLHSSDFGGNTFEQIIGFMCGKSNEYLNEEYVDKYCHGGEG